MPSPEPMPPARRVNVGEVTLSVHEAGPPDGVPVVLVHGWPELAHSWARQIPAIADAGFRVLAPDLRGFGGSDAPAEKEAYGIDALIGDLTGLLDAVGAEKAVFVGHDWGGLICWPAACLARERFLGVVGVNTPHLPRGARPPTEVFREAGGDLHYIVALQDEGAMEALQAGREDDFFAFSFATFPPREVTERMGASAYHLFDRFARFEGKEEARIAVPPADRAVYAEAYRRTGFLAPQHLYRNMDANWERMAGVDHRLSLPCLMISADRDFMLPPEMTRWMPALCSDLELHVIEGCGHWTQWEATETLNHLLVDWLARRFGSA